MKYEIPDSEVANFIHVYWVMLSEIEIQADNENDAMNKLMVEDAYTLLNRAGIHQGRPRWEEAK